jgi:hypothetical protein
MREVDSELFHFLKDNETGLYTKDFEKNKTVFAYVHIDFIDLPGFIDIVGEDHFCEGGIEAQLFSYTVCIEINDLIERHGHKLSSYKRCFNHGTWEQYEREIKEMEEELE